MILLVFQTFFVAIYSCFIFAILKNILNIQNKNVISLIFFTGFFKHFFGWVSGLQKLYCTLIQHISWNNSLITSFIESIIEGMLFVGLYFIIANKIKNNYLIIFIIGVFLHLSFDILGIHKMFCNKKLIFPIGESNPVLDLERVTS